MDFENNNLPPSVIKYLKKYASDNWRITVSENRKYNNVIVVPAIDEFNNLSVLIDSISKIDPKYFDDTLLLIVVNNTAEVEPDIRGNNMAAIDFLIDLVEGKFDKDETRKFKSLKLPSLGFVDASSSGYELPVKDGGVGLARKIGMDLALTVFNYEKGKRNLLICLDADCTVESNYLTSIVDEFNKTKAGAGYVNFIHPYPDEEEGKLAVICYELFLRYYVLGLAFANSPYAYHTIGSTIICDAEHYCKIGGMNKQKAAEDFYFMEKLAKITEIHLVKNSFVYPQGRKSWRVPFGTGQRIGRFLSHTQDEYLLYDPSSFLILKKWLDVFESSNKISGQEYITEAKKIDPALEQFLISNSFEDSWNKILSNSKSADQLQKQKMIWFDGFRSLKLIHFLRDNGYPQIKMFDALDKLMDLTGNKSNIEREQDIPSIDIQMKYLGILRKLI